MKTNITTKVSIAASPAEVFRYLTHLKYHFLWNPPLQSIKPLTTLKEDVSYKTVSMILGIKLEGNNRVAKLLENKELELQNDAGTLQYRVNYKLRSEQQKTVLTCSTTVSSESDAFAFAKPVLKLLARRELQSDLQALKLAVEQKLT